jgi:hypothetical protein
VLIAFKAACEIDGCPRATLDVIGGRGWIGAKFRTSIFDTRAYVAASVKAEQEPNEGNERVANPLILPLVSRHRPKETLEAAAARAHDASPIDAARQAPRLLGLQRCCHLKAHMVGSGRSGRAQSQPAVRQQAPSMRSRRSLCLGAKRCTQYSPTFTKEIGSMTAEVVRKIFVAIPVYSHDLDFRTVISLTQAAAEAAQYNFKLEVQFRVGNSLFAQDPQYAVERVRDDGLHRPVFC